MNSRECKETFFLFCCHFPQPSSSLLFFVLFEYAKHIHLSKENESQKCLKAVNWEKNFTTLTTHEAISFMMNWKSIYIQPTYPPCIHEYTLYICIIKLFIVFKAILSYVFFVLVGIKVEGFYNETKLIPKRHFSSWLWGRLSQFPFLVVDDYILFFVAHRFNQKCLLKYFIVKWFRIQKILTIQSIINKFIEFSLCFMWV